MSEVRSYRDEHQCSMQEAKAAVERQNKLHRLSQLRTRCFYAVLAPYQTAMILGDVIEELIEDIA